jgi:tetratricopeptide (TPR) repeat protein
MTGRPVGFGRGVGPGGAKRESVRAASNRARSPEAERQRLIARINELSQLDAEDPEGRWFLPLGRVLHDLGRFDEAAVVLRRGLERDSECLGGWVILGQCYAAMGEIQVARSLFEWISSRDPLNALVLRGLAAILARQGETERAADCYRALIKVMPRDLGAQEALAGLLDHAPDGEDPRRSNPALRDQVPRPPRGARGLSPEARPRRGIFEPPPADLDSGEPWPASRRAAGEGEAGRVLSGYRRWLERMTEEEEGQSGSSPAGKE